MMINVGVSVIPTAVLEWHTISALRMRFGTVTYTIYEGAWCTGLRNMSEIVSIDEVCRLLETLDEWEEVALYLGLSDKTIQEIRGLSGGKSLRRKAMVTKWVQREDLEHSWSKLEEALVSANQEPYAAMIRDRSRTDDKKNHDCHSEKGSRSSLKEMRLKFLRIIYYVAVPYVIDIIKLYNQFSMVNI